MRSGRSIIGGAFVAAAILFSVGCPTMPGGYSDISPKDEGAIKAAKFAVENAEKPADANYEFRGVLSARSQVVAGWNYDMCVQFNSGGEVSTARTIVYQKPDDSYDLTKWELVRCR